MVAILIFAVVFVIPILVNINDIADKGLICGATGLCVENFEDTETYLEEKEKQQDQADNRLPSTVGKTVCDLSITTKAVLIDEFGFAKFTVNEGDPADYQWHCQFPSVMNWFSSLNLTPLDFLAGDSETVRVQVKLIKKTDTSKWHDANHKDYRSMFSDVRYTDNSGLVKTPQNFEQQFYISNIVHDDYILEIFMGRQINDNNTGDPVIDSVCRVGESPC